MFSITNIIATDIVNNALLKVSCSIEYFTYNNINATTVSMIVV